MLEKVKVFFPTYLSLSRTISDPKTEIVKMVDTHVSRRGFIKGVGATAAVVASGMPVASNALPLETSQVNQLLLNLLHALQIDVHNIFKIANDYNLWRQKRLADYRSKTRFFITDFFIEDGVVDWKSISQDTTQDWWDANDLRVIEEIVANDPNYDPDYLSRDVWKNLKKEYDKNAKEILNQMLALEDNLIEYGWFDSLSEDEVKKFISNYHKVCVKDDGTVYQSNFASKFITCNSPNGQIAHKEWTKCIYDNCEKYKFKDKNIYIADIAAAKFLQKDGKTFYSAYCIVHRVLK